MSLALTQHAIHRFIDRWRPHASFRTARDELGEIASRAAQTRRSTINGDARIFTSTTSEGEDIALAVRDGAIITVMPPGSPYVETHFVHDQELLDESAATVAACRAMVTPPAPVPSPQPSALEQRRSSARDILNRKARGLNPTEKSLRRAYEILGMKWEEQDG